MKSRFSLLAVFLLMFCGAAVAQQATWVPVANVGGSGIAVTLTGINANQMSDLLGVPIRFIPTNSNNAGYTGTTTVNVNSIGPQAVKRVSGGSLVAIAGGDLSPGVPATIMWDGTEFVQTDPATGTDPIGTERHFTGPTVPNGWLVENGTCVSETTYAALWAYYGSDIWSPGSTGGACGAGNFHLPYANGRTAVAPDNQGSQTASVLTNAGSGCAATSVGVVCGAQNRTIGQANLPNVNFTVATNASNGVAIKDNAGLAASVLKNGASAPGVNGGASFNSFVSTDFVAGHVDIPSLSGTAASGGSGTALATLQPSYTVLKAVKY